MVGGFGVRGSAHEVFWPNYDSYDLGVLIGMIYGDGNLIRRQEASRTGKWRIEFCEGDLSLVRGYASLTHRLFNVRPTVRDRITWYEAYYRSRIAYDFLTYAAEHPNGKKAGRLAIPGIARKSASTMLGFVGGLFSVEDSAKVNSNARLAMEMLEPGLVQSLYVELRKFGFTPHTYHYPKDGKIMFGLYAYGLKDCSEFLGRVGLFGKEHES